MILEELNIPKQRLIYSSTFVNSVSFKYSYSVQGNFGFTTGLRNHHFDVVITK